MLLPCHLLDNINETIGFTPPSLEPSGSRLHLAQTNWKPKPFGDPTPIQKDYVKKDFLSDVANTNKIKLAGSVHIQVDSALADPVSETSWLSKFVPAGIPSAIVGYVDLTKEDAGDVLKRHLTYPKFRGVRQIIGKLEKRPDLSFTNENLLLNKSWQKNFALLEKHNLSFDLQLYPEQMNESAEFLSDFPEFQSL